MLNLRPFQIFLLAGFTILAVLSIALLSGFTPSRTSEATLYGQRVVVWGTFSRDIIDKTFSDLTDKDKTFSVVEYEQINANTFNKTLLDAIAEGRQPDLVLLPSSELVRQRNRLVAITYDTLPLRDFKNSYIDGAEIFARPDGVYAFPFAVDPIVMYWNRDLFATNGFAEEPTTWEYIVSTVVPAMTKRDNNSTILSSAISFGEFINVSSAKEILLLLTMQSGSKLIYEDSGSYEVSLNKSQNLTGLPPFEASTHFFSNFSNPNSSLYSWDRSQPLDRNAFLAGDLAMYFGYGSELAIIQRQNPNLNFDVALVPQGSSASVHRTYGEFYGFSVLRSAVNKQGAFLVAQKLVQPDVATSLTEALGLSPATRGAVTSGSSDPFRQVILASALISRSWLDPNPQSTNDIFKVMIEDIASGRETLSKAVRDAEYKIKLVF